METSLTGVDQDGRVLQSEDEENSPLFKTIEIE